MSEWSIIYLGWLFSLTAGCLVGYRAAYWHYLIARRRMIQRWRFERRKHRQLRPWVKAWVYRVRLSGRQWTKREYGRMTARQIKQTVLNEITK